MTPSSPREHATGTEEYGNRMGTRDQFLFYHPACIICYTDVHLHGNDT